MFLPPFFIIREMHLNNTVFFVCKGIKLSQKQTEFLILANIYNNIATPHWKHRGVVSLDCTDDGGGRQGQVIVSQ